MSVTGKDARARVRGPRYGVQSISIGLVFVSAKAYLESPNFDLGVLLLLHAAEDSDHPLLADRCLFRLLLLIFYFDLLCLHVCVQLDMTNHAALDFFQLNLRRLLWFHSKAAHRLCECKAVHIRREIDSGRRWPGQNGIGR